MLNHVVSIGDIALDRLISGILTMSLDHPLVMSGALTLMIVLVCALWVDLVAVRADVIRRQSKSPTGRPIRLRRS